MNIKISYAAKKSQFTTSPGLLEKLPSIHIQMISIFIDDLNKINKGRIINRCPFWIFVLLLISSFTTIFLAFISTLLIFVSIGFFVVFIFCLAFDLFVNLRFKRLITEVIQHHSQALNPTYKIKKDFYFDPICIILMPVENQTNSLNKCQDDRIPIYTLENENKSTMIQSEIILTEPVSLGNILDEKDDSKKNNTAYKLPIFDTEISFSNTILPLKQNGKK